MPASQSLATDLNVQNSPDNPATQFGIKNIYWSTIVDQILTNPTTATPTPGLGLSQADADNRWWHFNSKKRPPFKYMQIMPMTVRMAPADNYEMLDRGSSAVRSPRSGGCPRPGRRGRWFKIKLRTVRMAPADNYEMLEEIQSWRAATATRAVPRFRAR